VSCSSAANGTEHDASRTVLVIGRFATAPDCDSAWFTAPDGGGGGGTC